MQRAIAMTTALVVAWLVGIQSSQAQQYWVGWKTENSGGQAIVHVGYSTQNDVQACVCAGGTLGTNCRAFQVTYPVPDCAEVPAATQVYKIEFKGENNPFNQSFNITFPKDAEGQTYYEEVFVPLTARFIAMDISKAYNMGRVVSFSVMPVADTSSGTIPGGSGGTSGPGGTP